MMRKFADKLYYTRECSRTDFIDLVANAIIFSVTNQHSTKYEYDDAQ